MAFISLFFKSLCALNSIFSSTLQYPDKVCPLICRYRLRIDLRTGFLGQKIRMNFMKNFKIYGNLLILFLVFATKETLASPCERELVKHKVIKEHEVQTKCFYIDIESINANHKIFLPEHDPQNSIPEICKENSVYKLVDANKAEPKKLYSLVKSRDVCEHIAEPARQSKAQFSAACKTKGPLEQPGNCKALYNFLANGVKDFNKKPSATNQSRKIKDTDSTCESEGSVTIDFEPCVAFGKALAAWKAGQVVADQAQQVWMVGETQSAMAEAQGKTDDPKAALGAMKTSAEAQSTVVKQKAALESAKFAHLITLYKKIPTIETLESKNFKDVSEPQYGVLMNQEVMEDFKGELVKIGGTAVAQMIMAKIADDRVDAIDNAMAKVDSFKPVDFNVLQEDALTTFCQQNAEDPKCKQGDLSYNVDPFSGEVIQFGNSATGTTYSNVYADDSGTANALNPDGSAKNNNTLGPIGSTIGAVDKSNAIVDSSTAATVGDIAGRSGGGGGGSGSAGGGGGGGGGSAPGQKAQDSVAAAGTSSAVKYSGGTGVSVLGNGLSIGNRKSGKEDENPFGEMFKNKTAANGVLNLRGPASVGKKDGNIFEQISSRYKEVSANKERLLEYKEVP